MKIFSTTSVISDLSALPAGSQHHRSAGLIRDYFEAPVTHREIPRAKGATLQAAFARVLHPRGELNDRRELTQCIERINAPGPYVNDIDGVEKRLSELIKKNPANTDAFLWRGIVRRIAGLDGRRDLCEVLRRKPENRLAIINLAAMPLTVMTLELENDTVQSSLNLMKDYLSKYPDDLYAGVIKALLSAINKIGRDDIVFDLEQMYLKNPENILCLTTLACMLFYGYHRAAAKDYAQEAVRKDPTNVTANNILSRFPPHTIDEKAMVIPYKTVQSGIAFHEKWGLMTPYSQQDQEYKNAMTLPS